MDLQVVQDFCFYLKIYRDQEQTLISSLLQFIVFGRFEEIISLKVSNLIFLSSGHLKVTIPKANNYGLWDPRDTYIATY